MISKTILHYKITEKLGEGGMGVVYKAEDTKLKRDVAIKFLPRQIAASEEERQRFKIEAQAAAALNHPNIATIYAIEEHKPALADAGDEMFIVMEYIEGKELANLPKVLNLREVMDYASQIASGLQAAHEKGIVHRDIKSANIMITEKGQVKIMDFGLAKVLGGAELTKDQSTLGTAAYMSPEQARGEKIDHRTDIWAFGVVLYEMLTGQLPFPGDYEQAVIYAILNEEPEYNPDIPQGWQNIIHQALAKDKDTRYQSATDLLEDLKALAQGTAVTGMAPKAHKTKRNIVFTGIGLALLLAAFFVLSHNNGEPSGTREAAPVAATPSQWVKSIAVLPFSDLSQAKDQEYFCDGMTEQIITNLSHLQDLKVIARTSVMTFKGSNKTVPEIGKALNVSHVLEGSIRKAGKRIRVTAQLIEVQDGTHLWAQDYDRELQDIFGVQDDVSQAIAAALFEQLSPTDAQAVKTHQTENVAAYEYYLKGRFFHYNRFLYYFREEDFEKSEHMFRKAIELDPRYGLAYAGLADLYDTYLRHRQENKKYAALRQEFAEKAFQLDPGSDFVNTINGWAHWGQGEYERAFASMKGALELNPNDSYGNVSMALLLDHFGLEHQAITYSTRAVALDPLFATNYVTRGACYEALGNFAQATQDYEHGLEIDPEHMLSLNGLAEQYILSGRLDEAAHLLARCEKINPDYFLNKVTAAWLYAAKGEKEKALATHEDDVVYILLEMKDEAIQQLKKQHEQGWPLGVAGPRHGNYLSLKSLPIYDSLRDDPRFIEVLVKEKRRYEEYLRKYGDSQSR